MLERKWASKKQIVRFLHMLAETMEIPPRQLALAALEYANGVFGGADVPDGAADVTEDEAPDIDCKGQGTEPPVAPYTGSFHLCLDFGTAMSKAFAWDKESDTPKPLRIGHAAGEPASSPYAISSAVFISRDGIAFVGQEAVVLAATTDPERHGIFLSIKDILTVNPMNALEESRAQPVQPQRTSGQLQRGSCAVLGLPDRQCTPSVEGGPSRGQP